MFTITKQLCSFITISCVIHILRAAKSKSVVSVIITNGVTRDTCGGVLLTRYHVLSSSTCLRSKERHFIVELFQGRKQQRVGTPLDTNNDKSSPVTILSLSSPLSVSSADLRRGSVAPGQVTVMQKSGQMKCNMSASFNITCPHTIDTLWPVTDTNKHFIGFIDTSYVLQPINNHMLKVGKLLAADFATRFGSGEKRLLKCRGSEQTALLFILVKFYLKT